MSCLIDWKVTLNLALRSTNLEIDVSIGNKDINIVSGLRSALMIYTMKFLLVPVFLFLIFQANAQKAFQYDTTLPVSIDGKSLSMPFAGGINSAQIQQIDLNGDGQEELVIWDKNVASLSVFEKVNNHYVHRPMLQYSFPEDVNGFLILTDFDGDGRKDLFTSSPFGIKVYKNVTVSDIPQWEVAQEFLRLDNNSNLQMNNLDVPAIMDIDGDGDLDIVTFNFASGDFLEYYRNTSVERKGSPDIDGFAAAVTRWGGFEFCGCDSFSFGQTCSGRPITGMGRIENLKIEHAGGHSLLLHDFNGDGILDMLMGQDECNSLYYLINEGSNSNPEFRAFSKELPQLGSLPDFPVFHAAYFLDDDLVITTNSSNTASQQEVNYAQSLYHYQDGQTLTTKAFLQEDMLDLGENSRPFFRGNIHSGELIITANSLVDNKTVGKAYYFRLSPEGLLLEEEDYLQLSSMKLTDLQYLEVMTAANTRSLFISGVEVINFTAVRKLFWSSSLDGKGLQEISLPEVQLRGNDHLEFYRHQGKNYLLLARQTGELIRYEVEFGTVPNVQLLERDYLGFTDNVANRNLTVHVTEGSPGILDLYAIDQRGVLSHLPDFQNQTTTNSLLLLLEDEYPVQTRMGRNTWINSIPSPFGPISDLILGNSAGGLIYLKDVSTDLHPPVEEELQLNVFPNPSSATLNLLSSSAGEIRLINALGQVVLTDLTIQKEVPRQLNVQQFGAGVYFIQFVSTNGKGLTKKLIIKK